MQYKNDTVPSSSKWLKVFLVSWFKSRESVKVLNFKKET